MGYWLWHVGNVHWCGAVEQLVHKFNLRLKLSLSLSVLTAILQVNLG